MNALDLITIEKKLAAIVNLIFSISLKELETYLDLIKYLRVYVSWYSQASKFLQNRKILLLKNDSVKEKARKLFVKKTSLNESTKVELKSYEHLQSIFSKKSFLKHFDFYRKLFINVNILKKKSRRYDLSCQKKTQKKK